MNYQEVLKICNWLNFNTQNIGNLKLKFDLNATYNACKKYEIYFGKH